MRKFYDHGTRIALMMNSSDPDFEALQSCLYGFTSKNRVTKKYSEHPEFVEIFQRILKRESEVLKAELAAAT